MRRVQDQEKEVGGKLRGRVERGAKRVTAVITAP